MWPKRKAVVDEAEGLKDALQVLWIDATRKRRRRFPRGLLLWTAFLTLVGALAVARLWNGPIEVEVASAVRMDPSASTTVLTAGGYVVPRRKIELSPKITGRIEWIAVDRWDQVKTGQVLIVLDQETFTAQVEQSKSALDVAKAHLKELLAGSRGEEIEEARATVEQAQADLTLADRNFERMGRLFEKELVARQAIDEARNQQQVAQARLKAASERFRLVKAGPRAEQIERARAEVQEAQANAALARANLENTIILAPTDGTILERLAEAGETVTPNVLSARGAKSAVLSMADLRELRVEVDVNQNELKKLRLQMPTQVVPDAYPDRTYRGSLIEMAPEANRQKATLRVDVQLLEADEFIRPEMNVRVLFQEPPKKGGGPPRVFVPREAVVARGGAPVVYAILDGKAVSRPVTIGAEVDGNVEVQGLKGDETVVIHGAPALRDGRAVRTKP